MRIKQDLLVQTFDAGQHFGDVGTRDRDQAAPRADQRAQAPQRGSGHNGIAHPIRQEDGKIHDSIRQD